MEKSVIGIIATLDTKWRETEFVRECIDASGSRTVLIDIGVRNNPQNPLKADVPYSDIADKTKCGGVPIEELGKAEAVEAMSTGLASRISDIAAEWGIMAFIGMGGAQGSSMISSAYENLPIGFPCVLVSTVASGQRSFATITGTKDVIILNSLTDLLGVNGLNRHVLAHAAKIASYLGTNRNDFSRVAKKEKIAITAMGITNSCAEYIYDNLLEAGFEPYTFHSTGSGGDLMEKLIAEDYFDGVIDITTHELTSEHLGGYSKGNSKRLTSYKDVRIPVVIVPGALEIFDFPIKGNEKELKKRQYIKHNSELIHARCTKDELKLSTGLFTDRINRIPYKVGVCIPGGGYSRHSVKGEPLENKDLDSYMTETLMKKIESRHMVRLFKESIIEKAFADHVFNTFLELREHCQESSQAG